MFIAYALGAAIACYLVAAFIAAELNPSRWDAFGRFLVVLIWLSALVQLLGN